MVGRRLMIVALASCTCMFASVEATGSPPTINSISLRGLQIGATTTITIDGSELLPNPRLMLPVPITKQILRSGASRGHIEMDVKLGADVAPGTYNLRIATATGISNPVLIGVDSLSQLPVPAQLATLPAALSGTVAAGQIVQTSFTLKKGARIVVEVEAKRLGGGLDPIVNLLDDRNLPLAWAEATTALGGDARLAFTAGADGRYTVQLRDAVYQPQGPGHFRLKIGAWHYADLAFPPAVRRGTTASLEFATTNLPAGSKVDFSMPVDGTDRPEPWPADSRAAGFPPRVLASDDEQVLKSLAADGSPQQVTAPLGINGRLDRTRGEDQYRVKVTPGMRLRIEVTAARIGSPLDGVLFVRDERGNQLATNDDQPNTVDPGLDFTVPANTTAIVVGLKDVAGRGGPDSVYHLAVSRLDRPDFSLTLETDRLLIPPGGNALVRVTAKRNGFNGPIKLSFKGLPPGIEPAGDEIAAGRNLAFVELHGESDTAEAAVVSIMGQGADGDRTIVRTAQTQGGGSEADRMPWLRTELAVAEITSPAFALAWAGKSTGPAMLKAGSKTPLAVKLTRIKDAAGPVRLSLITSQPMPTKKVNVNNQDQERDDPDRAMRLEGSPMIAPDKADGTMTILVPADLPLEGYDIVVRGELLASDGKSVLAETVTPVLHMNAIAASHDQKPSEKASAEMKPGPPANEPK
jgi:hypothetical protein